MKIFYLYVIYLIQVLPSQPHTGCPQQPGSLHLLELSQLKSKMRNITGLSAAHSPSHSVRAASQSGAGGRQPLTQPSVRNEWSDAFPIAQRHITDGFVDLLTLKYCLCHQQSENSEVLVAIVDILLQRIWHRVFHHASLWFRYIVKNS